MLNDDKINLMRKLYMHQSKHSNYQILPSALKEVLPEEDLQISSRYERERMDYIIRHINLAGCKVLDIGGNSGFFTFEAVSTGAVCVDYFEGNKEHARFVQKAAEILELEEKIHIYNEFFTFEKIENQYDVIFCMNVLHHTGADFYTGISMREAKEKIQEYINKMAQHTNYLVLQLGFNWGGNRDTCLFHNGTKEEMEAFIEEHTSDLYEVVSVGIASKKSQGVVYEEINSENNKRIDEYGEFLNRPLYIMRSKNAYK